MTHLPDHSDLPPVDLAADTAGGTATLTKDEVTEAMKDVVDPELGINVVDLGLVYDVHLDETTKDVVLDMTLLDRVLHIEPGRVRVQAGACIETVLEAVRATGQQLMMYPSTMRSATIEAWKYAAPITRGSSASSASWSARSMSSRAAS